MPLGMELGLSPGCVRWGPRSTLPKKRAEPPPQFSAHVYCGQTAGCIKMPLRTEVDLGPGHFVLDGFPLSAKEAQQPPLFGPCLLWPWSPISATAELLFELLAVSDFNRLLSLTQE